MVDQKVLLVYVRLIRYNVLQYVSLLLIVSLLLLYQYVFSAPLDNQYSCLTRYKNHSD